MTNVFEYYHSDDLASTSVQTDQSGNEIQHYSHTAFGQSRYTQSATVTAHVGDVNLPTTFTVLAPSGISATVYTNVGLGMSGTNSIGADTVFNAQILPNAVSFANNTFREANFQPTTITWPNGMTRQFHYDIQKGLPPIHCDGGYGDEIGDGPNSIEDLYNGTNFVDFSYSVTWNDQYLDDSSNWVNFVDMQTTTEYKASGSCRETYQGASGSWQGPWQ